MWLTKSIVASFIQGWLAGGYFRIFRCKYSRRNQVCRGEKTLLYFTGKKKLRWSRISITAYGHIATLIAGCEYSIRGLSMYDSV